MRTEVERHERSARIVVQGEFDVALAHQPVELARDFLTRDDIDEVVLDLSAVTFIDSSGLGALVQIRNLAAQHHAAVVLTGVGRPVARLLALTGLDSVFTVRPPDQ